MVLSPSDPGIVYEYMSKKGTAFVEEHVPKMPSKYQLAINRSKARFCVWLK